MGTEMDGDGDGDGDWIGMGIGKGNVPQVPGDDITFNHEGVL